MLKIFNGKLSLALLMLFGVANAAEIMSNSVVAVNKKSKKDKKKNKKAMKKRGKAMKGKRGRKGRRGIRGRAKKPGHNISPVINHNPVVNPHKPIDEPIVTENAFFNEDNKKSMAIDFINKNPKEFDIFSQTEQEKFFNDVFTEVKEDKKILDKNYLKTQLKEVTRDANSKLKIIEDIENNPEYKTLKKHNEEIVKMERELTLARLELQRALIDNKNVDEKKQELKTAQDKLDDARKTFADAQQKDSKKDKIEDLLKKLEEAFKAKARAFLYEKIREDADEIFEIRREQIRMNEEIRELGKKKVTLEDSIEILNEKIIPQMPEIIKNIKGKEGQSISIDCNKAIQPENVIAPIAKEDEGTLIRIKRNIRFAFPGNERMALEMLAEEMIKNPDEYNATLNLKDAVGQNVQNVAAIKSRLVALLNYIIFNMSAKKAI